MAKNKTNKKNKKKKLNKEIILKTLLPWVIIATVIGGICLFVWLRMYVENRPEVTLVATEKGFYDKKSKINYLEAPMIYEAKLGITSPLYAKCGDTELYQIGYKNSDGKVVRIEAEKFIAKEQEDGLVLYYNPELVSLPTPEEFEVDTILICNELATIAKNVIEGSKADDVIAGYLQDDDVILPKVETKYVLRASSQKYEFLWLRFTLYCCKDGNFYIRDAGGEKTVRAYHSVFDQYFESETEG